MPDDSYWLSLAEDYLTAWSLAFPAAGGIASEPSHRWAIELAMSVAEHETNNGRAWPGTNNFGAVQLRILTAPEQAAFVAGAIKAGDYTPSRDGVLHVDTHPGVNGGPPTPYAVWFAAFPTRVEGIAHFLKTLYRLTDGEIGNPAVDVASLVTEMYCGHYFEDRWKDDRPWQARRAKPLSPTEQKDVDDYAHGATGHQGVQGCLDMIVPMLTAWDYGLDAAAGVTPIAGDPTA